MKNESPEPGLRRVSPSGQIKMVIYDIKDTEHPMVHRFRSLPGCGSRALEREEDFPGLVEGLKAQGFASREVVILKRFLGRRIQKCPGSPGMICCQYLLLNIGFNCPFRCAYCFLHSYLNSYGIVQFINCDDMAGELERSGLIKDGRVYRLGTGEFTDSLVFDDITGISARIAAEFSRFENLLVEFKTKSANVRHLLSIPEKRNVVLAWSLNTDRNIRKYEEGAASLSERLEEARAASGAGFHTAFHFDPIIPYEGFRDEYAAIVDRLFQAVDPEKVLWISMGFLRFGAGFREALEEQEQRPDFFADEMFPGRDGKYRAFKHERIGTYRALAEKIRARSGVPFIYLCMETSEVWDAVFGIPYLSSEDLESDFSDHLKRQLF